MVVHHNPGIDCKVSWESIVPIEETIPDLWGEEWKEHLKAAQTADTLGV